MKVIFWLLSEQHQVPSQPESDNITPHWHYACVLAADLYRQNRKILLASENQKDAQALDEWLWQFQADRFIPHNLAGEGPQYGTPVEINWEQSKQRRQCLVNTCQDLPAFFQNLKGYNEWHDFVPHDEAGKAAARERYKRLKQAGYEISTQAIPDSIV